MAKTGRFQELANRKLRDIETIAEIADRDPSLFREMAESFLEDVGQSPDATPPPRQRQSRGSVNTANFDKVVATFETLHNAPSTFNDLTEASGMTRSQVRHVMENTHADKFQKTGERVGRSDLWVRKGVTVGERTQPAARPPASNQDGRLPPTDAVIEWLRRNGDGTLAEITADLNGVVLTDSPDLKRVLSATLSNLHGQGRVTAEGENGSRRYALAGREVLL